jgi:hypothetical protein
MCIKFPTGILRGKPLAQIFPLALGCVDLVRKGQPFIHELKKAD